MQNPIKSGDRSFRTTPSAAINQSSFITAATRRMQNAAISIICLTVRFFIIPHPYRGIPALNYLFFIITYIERKIYLKSKKSAVLT